MAFLYSMALQCLKVNRFILRPLSFIGILSLLLLAGACQEPATQKPAPVKALYFDVPGFIQSQVTLLEQENPGALKSVVENHQPRERKNLHNLKWSRELAVFAGLDLNKPAFRNTFTVTRRPAAGGGVTETYRQKPGTEGDISLLSVTTGPGQQVRALRAIRNNANPLIASSQELALTCKDKDGRSRIHTFRIAGRQKPIIFDTLSYLIITEIQ
jgi:hypothetical protein